MVKQTILCSICGKVRFRESRLPPGWQEKFVVIKTPGEKIPFMSGSLYRCPEHPWLNPDEEDGRNVVQT